MNSIKYEHSRKVLYVLLEGGRSNVEEYRVFPNLGVNQISAGICNFLVRTANREYPDQTASEEAV